MAPMDPRSTRILPDLAATEALGQLVARLLRPGDAVLLDGPLGAGKTALARALLRAACRDAQMEVPSPSYTLVQTYDGTTARGDPLPIAHFDLWRLEPCDDCRAPSAIEELGWDEAREGVVLVEWPDRLGTLAPADALRLTLRLLPSGTPGEDAPRQLVLRGWADRLPAGPVPA